MPAVYLKPSTIAVPEPIQLMRKFEGNISLAIAEEEGWIRNGIDALSDPNHIHIKKCVLASISCFTSERSNRLTSCNSTTSII